MLLNNCAVIWAPRGVAVCPRCVHQTPKLHDVRRCTMADEPLGQQRITLILLRWRFRCLRCEVVFTKPNAIAGHRRRLIQRFRECLAHEAQHQTVQPVAAIYGVSPTTVRRAVTESAAKQLAEPIPPVRKLGIDEFAIRKGQRYATGLHDLERRRLVEVVEGRTSADVQTALERLRDKERVEVVSMDMSVAFREAVRLVLPEAMLVVDKFHVVARVNKAVREVWKRLVAGKERDDPLRQRGRLVLRNREELRTTEWEALWPVLKVHPELRQAWLLKEEVRRWYRQPKNSRGGSESTPGVASSGACRGRACGVSEVAWHAGSVAVGEEKEVRRRPHEAWPPPQAIVPVPLQGSHGVLTYAAGSLRRAYRASRIREPGVWTRADTCGTLSMG